MADIKIGMILQDNGSIKQKTEETKGLNAQLEKVKKNSQVALAAKGKASSTEELVDYNRARAGGMGTGAAGRDFANQAQGLGGLVRLYATYAANIFAVSAAFASLREAMNTENMINGMNQLGAASGQALGNLSKRFMDATDGAVSLREAMEATVKATSSGLSSDQVLQIADVAKKASQALGVSMNDAVNRLTRGITKLEPELLDELAIFTKIGPATEEYARSVGKTASTLTDFERRQAFANAVLEEGSKKFGEIELAANPYDKLLAQLKNVALEGLTLVNKVLVPIIDALSSSPTALAIAIAFVGKTIISQAIPAIGQWRNSLAAAAAAAAETAEDISFRTKEAFTLAFERNLGVPQMKKVVEDTRAEIAKLSIPTTFGLSTARMVASNRANENFTPEYVEKINKAIANQEKVVNRLGKSQEAADIAKVTAAQNNILFLQRERAAVEANILAVNRLNAAYDTIDKADATNRLKPSFLSQEAIADSRADAAKAKASKLQAISTAASATATLGLVGAISELDRVVDGSKLGKFDSAVAKLGGRFVAVGSAVLNLGGYLLRFIAGPVALLIAAVGLLDLAFSKNSAEIDKLNTSLDNSKSAAESAAATFKKYSDSLGVERASAFNNVVSESSSVIKQAAKDAEKAFKNQSWLDKIYDVIKRPADKDLRSKMTEVIVSQVESTKSALRDPKLVKEFEASIKEVLNTIDPTEFDVKNLLNMKDGENAAKIMLGVAKAIEEIGKKSALANTPLQAMKEGFSQLEKDYMDFSNSLISSDPFTKLSLSMIRQSEAMAEAFSDPTNMAEALADILKDTSKIKMFPPEAQSLIINAAKDMETYTAQMSKANKDVADLSAKLMGLKSLGDTGDLRIEAEIRITEEKLRQAGVDLQTAADKMQGIKADLTKATMISNKVGFEMMTTALVAATAKSAIEVRKSIFANAKETIGTINYNASLDKQAIGVQIEEIRAMHRLTDAIDLDRLTRERDALLAKQAAGKVGPTSENLAISQNLRKLDAMIKVLTPAEVGRKSNFGEISIEEAAAAPLTARKLGVQKQLAGLFGQQKIIDIQAQQKSTGLMFDNAIAQYQRMGENLSKVRKAQEDSVQFSRLNGEEQAKILDYYEDQAHYIETAIEQLKSYKELATANVMLEQAKGTGLSRAVATAKELVDLAEDGLNQTGEGIRLSREALVKAQENRREKAKEVEDLKKINHELQLRLDLIDEAEEKERNAAKIRESSVDLELATLESLNRKGYILSEVYASQVRAIELAKIESSRLLELEEARRDIARQRIDLERGIAENKTKNPEEADRLRNRLQGLDAVLQQREDAINRAADSAKKVRELQEDLGEHLQGYDEIFRNTFQGMADAIVEFVKTGKLNFKDLVTDMISEIIRLELRMQAMKMWEGIRGGKDGSGILGFIGNLIGVATGLGSPTAVPYTAPNISTGAGLYGGTFSLAKGAAIEGGTINAANDAFFNGMQQFANGGMFTNSVVSQPTLFAFNKGGSLGLMGEAGPEAIMPLKRDEDGVLGVRANVAQTKVDVVVNNYSGAQATAQETVDSRGNRRIEVTVSEMVAGEMIRPGSSTNQALRGATGSRPYVVRR